MKRIIAIFLIISITACQQPGQNTYDEKDLGKASIVVFGTVISERSVNIKRETSGAGATAGAAAGLVGGSAVGGGRGELLMMIAGALVGGVAGHFAEQGIINDKGIEYTIKTIDPGKDFKKIITIAQNVSKDDEPIEKGDCVMVQVGQTFQRVLSTDDEDCESKHHKKKHKKEADDE